MRSYSSAWISARTRCRGRRRSMPATGRRQAMGLPGGRGSPSECVTVVRPSARPEPCGWRAWRPPGPVQRRAPAPPPAPKRDNEPARLPRRHRRGRLGRRLCRGASAVLRLRPGLEFRRRHPGGVVVVGPPVGQFPLGGVSLHAGLQFRWRDSGRLLVVVPVLRLLSLGGGVLVVGLGGGSRAGQVHGRHRGPDADLECPASGVSAVELYNGHRPHRSLGQPPLGTVPRRLQQPRCRFNGMIISVG
jgi:hypothetical protein